MSMQFHAVGIFFEDKNRKLQDVYDYDAEILPIAQEVLDNPDEIRDALMGVHGNEPPRESSAPYIMVVIGDGNILRKWVIDGMGEYILKAM